MIQVLGIFAAILIVFISLGSFMGWIISLFGGGWLITAFGGVLGFGAGVACLYVITSKWNVQ